MDTTHISRPTPLPDPVDPIDFIAHQLGLTVYPDDDYAQSGLLAPGTYARKDAIAFLESILTTFTTNEQIDDWIAANPLP